MDRYKKGRDLKCFKKKVNVNLSKRDHDDVNKEVVYRNQAEVVFL